MSNVKIQMSEAAFILFIFNVSLFSQINDTWLGIWKGELKIHTYGDADIRHTLPMELHVSKADSAGVWNWRIIYRDSTKDDRKYLLRIDDYNNGKYFIDETDGILLEANLFGNKLISRFEVMSSLLEITYTLGGDKILFEVSSSKVKPTSVTQSQAEQIEVKSYEITSYQTAVLYKLE
ncbi:MAG TPA: hypothetical protein PKE39_13140 [Ignavibacteria bacterium]|nr:hypothetical protein [Ignavibacteria bacterium]HMQ99965.1 hypothetical protein [Ignavibacteria bacterium]